MEFEVIDAHVHIGRGYDFSGYSEEIIKTSIEGAVIFPQAHDIYQPNNEYFQDNPDWKRRRKEANKYILSLSGNKNIKINLYSFKFVWNDFNREDFEKYFGVKWHRHKGDPEYWSGNSKFYPKFIKLVKGLRERDMPIIFEDEFDTTMKFLNTWSEGINVIIPHLGFGNENYKRLENEGVWKRDNVYTDTSFGGGLPVNLAKKHIDKYGADKVLFGSDYPFSHPQEELEKILSINLSDDAKKAITRGNILRLLNNVKK